MKGRCIMKKEVKDLQLLAAGMEVGAQQKEKDVIELFDKIFKDNIPYKYAMNFIRDRLQCFNNPGNLNELYIKTKNVISDLLESYYDVTQVLNKNKCTIDELIVLCASSEEARIRIAQCGYGLNTLAKDPSNRVRLEVLRNGYYWDDIMLYSNHEIALEAISRGIALPQFVNSRPILIVQVKAICKLIELHSYDIYKHAIRGLVCGIETVNDNVIIGNQYVLRDNDCIELMRTIVNLQEVVRTEVFDSGIDNLI